MTRCYLLAALLAVVLPSAASAQQVLLEPISGLDFMARNNWIAATATADGDLMCVAKGEVDGEKCFRSFRRTGTGWEMRALPPPDGETDLTKVTDLRSLAGCGGKFAVAYSGPGYRYAVYHDGTWSRGKELPGRETFGHLGVTATGRLVFYSDLGAKLRLLRGEDTIVVKLPSSLDVPSDSQAFYVTRSGSLHLVGRGVRMVPTCASLAPGADPTQAGAWSMQPSGNNENSFDLPSSNSRMALDWARQRIWYSYTKNYKLYAACAPLGTRQSSGWQSWEIPLPAGTKVSAHRLAASVTGATGLIYLLYYKDGGRELHFRWLSPSGPGSDTLVGRPGTQTEACEFASYDTSSFNLVVGPDGTAHFFMVGRKRGEEPANLERVYYGRIPGGPVSREEPDVAGGTQTAQDDGQRPGTDGTQRDGQGAQDAKPDLIVTVKLDLKPVSFQGREMVRYSHYDRQVEPDVVITNQGAEYYGDLTCDVEVDGVLFHYRYPDPSDHKLPMLERGQSKTLYDVCAFRYELSQPQPGWQPPELSVVHPQKPGTMQVYTGLGRKRMTVTVDPGNEVVEADESNNQATVEFSVSDGRQVDDQIRLQNANGSQSCGRNDLAILGQPQLIPNTPIAGPGLVQRPVTVRFIVGNPGRAHWFQNVPLVALLDGREVWRETIPLVDNELRLYNRETAPFGYTAPPRRSGPEICGGFVTATVDLSSTPPGRHALQLCVDPEDIFSDLERTNNVATINFNVREPGGLLRVRVLDRDSGAAVARAHVLLDSLYFGVCNEAGILEIGDVPPGDYQAERLSASRPYPDPTYARQTAGGGFRVVRGQETSAQVLLERPVHVVVRILDTETGQPVAEPMAASLRPLGSGASGQDSGDTRTGARGPSGLHFANVPPGRCEVTGGAYGFETRTEILEVHRDTKGECHLEVRVPRKPRGSISGRVKDAAGKALSGAEVWLNGAPRATSTDSQGQYTLTEVEAGRDYQVLACKSGYLTGRAMSGTVIPGGSRTADLSLTKVDPAHKSISFDAVTWAMIESWPGFDFFGVTSSGYKVNAQFGEFNGSMGLIYHTLQGQGTAIVDEVVVAFKPGLFWRSSCSFEYDPLDLISEAVDTVKEGIATAALGTRAGKAALQLAKLADPINDVYDYLTADIDPSQLHDGEVVGTFTSHTGDKYQSASLIDLDLTTMDVGLEYGGGQTVIRCDIVQVTDGTNTATIRRQWYSPRMAIYPVGREMDLSKLQVIFYVQVLNQDLSPGPLYANSRNVLIWKPMERNWLRFEPRMYDPLAGP